MVGVSRNAVVGHTDSHPHGTAHAGTFANHFHDPHFIGVGNGEGLATAAVAILLHQVSHHLDGFACRTRTLQAQINQAAVVDDARCVHQFGTPAEGRFADGQLEFVHVAHHVVRLACLFYLSQVLARVPLIDIDHRPLLVHACGIVIQLAEQGVGVGRIGNDGRTVGRHVLAYNEVGTGQSIGHSCRHANDGKGQSSNLHNRYFY